MGKEDHPRCLSLIHANAARGNAGTDGNGAGAVTPTMTPDQVGVDALAKRIIVTA
jgi:hypothetical protein